MKIIEQHAPWLPKPRLFFKQMVVSLWSYLTIPFFKKKKKGIQLFFKRNYYIQEDTLIFDGNLYGYYDKAIDLIEKSSRNLVIDLGCGDNGSFYWWLVKNQKKFDSYIGIDFAIKENSINSQARLINDNVIFFDKYREINQTAMIVLSNSLCYLSDKYFNEILKKVKSGDEILIFEPEPNLFWDAHFDGVMPIYRNHEKVISRLQKGGFDVTALSIDYLFKRKGKIAYGLYGIKK